MSTSTPAASGVDSAIVIDLTDEASWEDTYTPQRVLSWLRHSEGSLGERAMKQAAADIIEEHLATPTDAIRA